jgi:hypothetical protein
VEYSVSTLQQLLREGATPERRAALAAAANHVLALRNGNWLDLEPETAVSRAVKRKDWAGSEGETLTEPALSQAGVSTPRRSTHCRSVDVVIDNTVLDRPVIH